ncbi:MAG: hypothetical protein ACI9XO_001476 [Paraglaciecola sp.]|jgi:hypothetical protein
MKKIAALLAFLLCFQNGFTQIIESSCETPDSILTFYEFDAKILAARQMQGDPAYTNETEIDPDLTNFYLEKLAAVHHATNFATGDSVTKCLPIHVFPEAVLSWFVISLDNNEAWVQALEMGISPTGYDLFDSLFLNLELEVKVIIGSSNPITVILETENCLHLEGVINAFQELNGVNFVEPDFYIGDGNNITAEVENGYTDLIFEHAWGDCPSGCIFSHFWQIRVYDDCSVAFIDSWGEPVDFPCESIIINDIGENNSLPKVSIFPTIAKDILIIKMEETTFTNAFLSIYSIGGKPEIQGISFENESQEVDISTLSKGIHILILNIDNRTITKRFLKI